MKTLLKFVVVNLLALDAMIAFTLISCWFYPSWVTQTLRPLCAHIVIAALKY